MNMFEKNAGEAVVQYLDGDLRVVKPGAYVLCSVTGAKIQLDELKYWNVETQEAFASFNEVAERIGLKLRSSDKKGS